MSSIRSFVKKGERQPTSGMIGLFGLKPFDDIDIVFTGMRPGEKLFEELNTEGEDISKTKHPKIFMGRSTPMTIGLWWGRSRSLRSCRLLAMRGS